MNNQDTLIRLLKAEHITEEEFKLLYEMTLKTDSTEQVLKWPVNDPSKDPLPMIYTHGSNETTFKTGGIQGNIFIGRKPTNQVVGSSGFFSGPTVSLSNGN